MITTPEQMREAAIAVCVKNQALAQKQGRGDFIAHSIDAAEIRAIPIAPQPVDDQASDMKRIAYKAGYVQAECGLPCPADIDAAFAAWLASFSQPVAVTVKPLVWRSSYGCLIAKGVGVEYYAFTKGWNTSLDGTTYPAESREDAVAACQAHHDALIRAELIIQPADPLSDPRVVALVEAAHRYMQGGYDYRHTLAAALRAIGGEA